MLVASFGNGTSFLSGTALYCTLVALPCAGATEMYTPRASGPFLSDRLRWLSFSDTEVLCAAYFCQPSATRALSTVPAVCATGSEDVKIVLAGLEKMTLAPATRGSLLVSSVRLVSAALSDFSDFEQAVSSSKIHKSARNKESGAWPNRVLDPVMPRMFDLAFVLVRSIRTYVPRAWSAVPQSQSLQGFPPARCYPIGRIMWPVGSLKSYVRR